MKHLSLLALALILVACQSNPNKTAAENPSDKGRPKYGRGAISPNEYRKPQPGMDKEDILLILRKPYRVEKTRTNSAYEICGPKGTEVEQWSYEVVVNPPSKSPHDGLKVDFLFKGELVCAITYTR